MPRRLPAPDYRPPVSTKNLEGRISPVVRKTTVSLSADSREAVQTPSTTFDSISVHSLDEEDLFASKEKVLSAQLSFPEQEGFFDLPFSSKLPVGVTAWEILTKGEKGVFVSEESQKK